MKLCRVVNLSPVFGGINLEDIAAPQCFDIEQRLTESLDIPVFHDDQHNAGSASWLMLNAVKIVGKTLGNLRLVVSSAGSYCPQRSPFADESWGGQCDYL
ncbi:MAG: hypothetical protein U0003_00965 [Vampirovibrionales bacterium]